ncbi:succinate semialdehyde dehydrogenase NADP+ linked [Exophiala xenobiotica]|nr:succinate semialdehyde dehydrogenase NADP+ linked [Exophiala xenobiotica]KAK5500025.1 succinate semialdehyde dehydrogenase NADP+ linked [Exophiala xenobiotica]KAK5560184.1 succinate semialdehyde dehydrogenase NADP+ linked [Exophiala xenobiotica]
MYKSPPQSEMLYWCELAVVAVFYSRSSRLFLRWNLRPSWNLRFLSREIQARNHPEHPACKAVKKITELVSDAESKGAKAVLGGKRDDSAPETFYPATILKDMTSDMQASQTELFGPVATVYKFDSEQEAIKAANKASVGLAGYVYTSDIGRAWRTAEALQVGMTGVNTGIVSDPYAPFGGVKESGFGREGGRHGIEEFQISKTVTLGGLGLPSSQL